MPKGKPKQVAEAPKAAPQETKAPAAKPTPDIGKPGNKLEGVRWQGGRITRPPK